MEPEILDQCGQQGRLPLKTEKKTSQIELKL